MRIELTYPAWKAGVLPLNYTRVISDTIGIFTPASSLTQSVSYHTFQMIASFFYNFFIFA